MKKKNKDMNSTLDFRWNDEWGIHISVSKLIDSTRKMRYFTQTVSDCSERYTAHTVHSACYFSCKQK